MACSLLGWDDLDHLYWIPLLMSFPAHWKLVGVSYGPIEL